MCTICDVQNLHFELYINNNNGLRRFLRIFSEKDRLKEGEVYADKAYIDEILRQLLEQEQQIALYTPVKKEKGKGCINL